MKKYPCPHCGRPTITFWRRLFLGPALPTTCSECGGRVGVPWSSVWLGFLCGLTGALIPGILIPLRKELSIEARVLAVTFLVGVGVSLTYVWFRIVPLVRR